MIYYRYNFKIVGNVAIFNSYTRPLDDILYYDKEQEQIMTIKDFLDVYGKEIEEIERYKALGGVRKTEELYPLVVDALKNVPYGIFENAEEFWWTAPCIEDRIDELLAEEEQDTYVQMEYERSERRSHAYY